MKVIFYYVSSMKRDVVVNSVQQAVKPSRKCLLSVLNSTVVEKCRKLEQSRNFPFNDLPVTLFFV